MALFGGPGPLLSDLIMSHLRCSIHLKHDLIRLVRLDMIQLQIWVCLKQAHAPANDHGQCNHMPQQTAIINASLLIKHLIWGSEASRSAALHQSEAGPVQWFSPTGMVPCRIGRYWEYGPIKSFQESKMRVSSAINL